MGSERIEMEGAGTNPRLFRDFHLLHRHEVAGVTVPFVEK